jgi:tetratricopeptide (TPR) repeat protein
LSHPEGSLEILQNGERLAHELGDEEVLVQVYGSLSTYYSSTGGKPSLGLEYAEKCFNSAEKIKDFELMAQSAARLCAAYFLTVDVTKVVDIGSRAIDLLEENHREKDSFAMGFNVYSVLSVFYGTSLGWMGRPRGGTDVLEKGFRNACEVNDKYLMGFTKYMHSTVTYIAGYGDSTIAYAQEGIKTLEEAEIFLGLEIAWGMVGAGYFLCRDYDNAIKSGEKSLKFGKEFGMPYNVAWSYWHMAMTLRDAGDLRRAREYAEEALRISQECNGKSVEGLAQILLGCMVEEITPSIIEKAQHQIRHGIAILDDLKLKSWSAVGYLLLGEFLANAGRKEEATESLKKAETLYEEMEVTPESYWLTRTKDAIKKLGSAAGAT